jgi:23S rRNA pseudouridine2605 synthase
MVEERLQKVLASAGVASRRACEELITAGRVQVNGRTVTELGTKVDPALVQIAVDGKPVVIPSHHVYYKLHKPRGVLSDIGGPTYGRQTVLDLLPPDVRRVFPVGRLDLNSEGLVLLTDDGELAHHLTHPRYEHPKTYFVLVAEPPSATALNTLRRGVDLSEGRTAPAQVRVVEKLPKELDLAPGPATGVWLEIVLREGKKRQIRHMTAAVGHPTLRLVRWAIGPLLLGDLKVGQAALLTRRELAGLRTWVHQPISARRQAAAPNRPPQNKPKRRAGAQAAQPRRAATPPRRPRRPRPPRPSRRG